MSYQIFVDDSVEVTTTTTPHGPSTFELKAKNRGMGKAESDRYIDELKRELAEAHRQRDAALQGKAERDRYIGDLSSQRDAAIAERDYADTELGTARAALFGMTAERDTALMRIRELEQRTTIATMGEEQPICNEAGWSRIKRLTTALEDAQRELAAIDIGF